MTPEPQRDMAPMTILIGAVLILIIVSLSVVIVYQQSRIDSLGYAYSSCNDQSEYFAKTIHLLKDRLEVSCIFRLPNENSTLAKTINWSKVCDSEVNDADISNHAWR